MKLIKIQLIILGTFLPLVIGAFAQPTLIPEAGVIPAPGKIVFQAGQFYLDDQVRIICLNSKANAAASCLQAGLKSRKSWQLALLSSRKESGRMISLEVDAHQKIPLEGYSLVVAANGVTLRAASTAGLFYGVQSLLQMVDAQSGTNRGAISLPGVTITDAPRYEWRGLLLDESDHFFGKENVEELLDMMAYLKMNRFHWHLTDDYGWRIEIKRYPKLTQSGASRDFTEPHSPPLFYSQADIREIVKYAQARHIVIIPEIDMPGHATAATQAYLEISGGGVGKYANYTFNPAKPETYQFLRNVLSEVCDMFPGPYLHLGGDEVWFGNQPWSTDPQIVKFTRDQGLANAVDLEHYFTRRMTGVIRDLGKTPMGWDEITQAGVSPSEAIIFWWRQDKTNVLQQALAENYQIVLCPRLPTYLNYVQDASHKIGRRWKTKFNGMDEVYNFPEPVMNDFISADKERNILGIEACLWTEFIPSRARLDFMTFPRLAAVAEDAWTPAVRKNQNEFMARLPAFLRELDRRKIPYYDIFSPTNTPEPYGSEKQYYLSPPSQ